MNVTATIEKIARTSPDATAIVDGSRTLSYSELADLLGRTAGHLASLGVKPGETVATCLKDNSDHLIVLLAVMHAGASALPLDWRGRRSEHDRLAELLNAKLAVVEPGTDSLARVPTIALDDAWRHVVDLAQPTAPHQVGPNATCIVNLTSGTTGTPRCFAVSHGNVTARVRSKWAGLGLKRGQRAFSAGPFCFAATFNQLAMQLLGGNTVVLYPPLFSADEYVEAVLRTESTYAIAVPTVLRRLLDVAPQTGLLFPSLQWLVTGTAPATLEERAEFSRRICPRLYHQFGSTGTGTLTTLAPEDIAHHSDSVGRILTGFEMRIVGDDGLEVPNGAPGHLKVRGATVASQIAGPESFVRLPHAAGWCHTDDIASRDDEGFLTHLGRASDVIIRGGVNIYPAEIEGALMAHPSVSEAAVVGAPHQELGEEVIAYYVGCGTIDGADLKRHCRAQMSPHKLPVRFVRLDAFPRNTANKIVKSALADQPVARAADPLSGHGLR